MAQENGKPQNGKARLDDRVRVALVGVGNCANSLLQGVEYYKDAPDDQFVPGLMHVNLGGYHIRDIEFTAAFDVTTDKVGKDLADAIWAKPNDTIKFADVSQTGVKVSRGMTHDGLGKYISQVVTKAPGETSDVVGLLRDTKTDVIVNYLPVGSEAATKWYMEQALEAGCAVVNCMPVFIAREKYWQRRFEEKGLPIIGDDIKSPFGDVPLNLELKLEVWDSPNSAGIVIDAVRLAKLALNDGVGGALEGPSSYLMKSPPAQVPDDDAYDATEGFIREHARKASRASAPEPAETT